MRLQVSVLSLFLCCCAADLLAADQLTFEHDVRPILKAHCFHCHGEGQEREGGLDLRLKRLVAQGGETGAGLIPGDASASLIIKRLRAGEMPPDKDKLLKAEEIDIIANWIETGAVTAEAEPESIGDGPLFTAAERSYWAFQPITRPAVPRIDGAAPDSPIDAFLLNVPNHPGFASSAQRALLVRRAAFDLTGLPPSPEMLESAVADTSMDWWSKVITQLLDSPHYGERWGRHWLDVAGYADSEGYTDEDRIREQAWRYRDYVIRSFNADKPFDLFVQEQLAGDEMVPPISPNLTEEQIEKLTATGFLRMAPDGTASGGINQTEARNQVVADTMQIVGSSLMGMTLHCAQCHDHRYDPIPQADYYRLRAVFEPALDWKNWQTPPQRQVSLYTDADREIARQLEAEAAEIEKQRLAKAEEYITRTLEEELLLVSEDRREALRVAYRAAEKDRSEEQKNLLKEFPSVASISTGSLYLYDQRRDERARKLDSGRKEKEQKFVAETKAAALAAIPEQERPLVEQALAAATEARTPDQNELLAKYPAVQVTLATLAEYNPSAAAELQRDKEQAEELRNSKAAEDLKKYADNAATVRGKKPEEGFLRALHELPGNVPATVVFHRGDPEQPRDAVQPGDLSILADRPAIPADDPAIPTTGRRLAFAKELTDGTHPLFARVIVNRIWLQHFGRGIVDSPADFGMLGERPTHPELLDWLACEFRDSGWSMKHMHKVIMQSQAYQQSAIPGAAALASDPENKLYSRFPVRRLESEVLRDAMLAVSGKLNDKAFGPPIPVMEDSVGQIVLGMENLDGERKPVDKVDLHGEEYRRSIYIQVRRTRTYSMFEAFDAPAMTPNCERRSASTVAPQSLFFMNSDLAIEFAGFFADRLLAETPGGTDSQVRHAWEQAFATSPTDAELAEACLLIERQQELIAAQGEKEKATAPREALSLFCQALLSSNRFLYVE